MDGSGHPFIGTEAREDILFLKDQLRSAAAASLAAHVDVATAAAAAAASNDPSPPPPSKSQLAAVNALVEKFIDETFRLAGPNITVNGIAYEEAFKTVEEFEPFDENLRASVEDLLVQATSAQARVAHLRVAVPTKLLEAETERVGRAVERPRLRAGGGGAEVEEDEVMEEADSGVVRMEAVAEAFSAKADRLADCTNIAVRQIGSLTKMVPATADKWDRANMIMDDRGIAPAVAMADAEAGASSGSNVPVTPRKARSQVLMKLRDDGEA
ncbi:hypothetical protein DFJ73DRAFT_58385 [Zopfochytrium polystomum]|nr:hypothetical protein DFJ73DRAFT_58385 [Zopfochytrium polystomum]